MSSSLVAISTLVKSNVGEKCIASFLINVSNESLRDYLRLVIIYKGDAIKKKTDLIEMIIYGCFANKLNDEGIEDISANHATKILKRNVMSIK